MESGKRIAEKWKVPFVEASAKENQVGQQWQATLAQLIA